MGSFQDWAKVMAQGQPCLTPAFEAEAQKQEDLMWRDERDALARVLSSLLGSPRP